MTDCLGLICASHHGLIEEELLEMLGSGWDGSETLPRGIWAQLQQNISFIVSKFRGVQVGAVYECIGAALLSLRRTAGQRFMLLVGLLCMSEIFDVHQQSVYKIVHSQFLDGVRRRYLNDPEQRERIYDRLVDFYRSKGDPLGDHSWTGDNHRAFQDIVFYQVGCAVVLKSIVCGSACPMYWP